MIRTYWRGFLARLPLPMLALAASYGVYSFAGLFVPQWVAAVQAAAFELTYIGLAVQPGLREDARRRATAISVGAVVVSILYNTLAGLFHRNPAWLLAMPWYAEGGLAILHGAPLAWVAYLVSDLLLHSEPAQPAMVAARVEVPAQPVYAPPVQVEAPAQPAPRKAAPKAAQGDPRAAQRERYRALIAQGMSGRAAAREVGVSESTARAWR